MEVVGLFVSFAAAWLVGACSEPFPSLALKSSGIPPHRVYYRTVAVADKVGPNSNCNDPHFRLEFGAAFLASVVSQALYKKQCQFAYFWSALLNMFR